MAAALDTVRVLDMTTGQALVAGNMLGKLGADVLAIEPPGGSMTRRGNGTPQGWALWSAFSAGKRGITCNLASEQGRGLISKLARHAHIVITGGDLTGTTAPGIDWKALLHDNPRLIHVSITPFGESGPKANYAATDLIIWAAGGPLFPSRDGELPPLRISSDQAMLHAGIDAAVGALVALAAREVTGRGQHVAVSAQASAAQATLSVILAAAVGHENYSMIRPDPKPKPGAKKPLDLSGSGSRTRRSKWPVKDGMVEMHMAMGPSAGRFTNNLFAWLRGIDACDPRFGEWDWTRQVPAAIEAGELSDDEIEAARADVAAALARFTKAELIEVSMRHKLLIAPIMTIADLAHGEQFAARRVFDDVEEAGVMRRVPGALTGRAASQGLRPAPLVGEHNAEIYAEIGIGEEALSALRAEGVI